ncbi:hypothetical protein [Pleionea sp. CnH1-48]|uniref:hypothetical protein n=1 Tax=Pleionea sp. CnH1-48 TaxID=2954494 RepID=UPI00209831AB|nr:hypothetical protein [Pleionea sp. CnH1-48]MCO7227609.1 hypothetical protein [Pleionea sp. CnH1-48]
MNICELADTQNNLQGLLKKWRFKPKVENGKAVPMYDLFYTMDFTPADEGD